MLLTKIPEASLWLVVKDLSIATRLWAWVIGFRSWLATHVSWEFVINNALTTQLSSRAVIVFTAAQRLSDLHLRHSAVTTCLRKYTSPLNQLNCCLIYTYKRPVSVGVCVAQLRPNERTVTTVPRHTIAVTWVWLWKH